MGGLLPYFFSLLIEVFVMRVVMVAKISGTRNGVDWPEPGESIELDADEAVQLLNGGLAKPTADVETAAVVSDVETADVAPKGRRK